MKVKICGMRSPGNLEQICALSPDYVGFIFYPGSKRFVGTLPDPSLFHIPGPEIQKVGVFVNEAPASVLHTFETHQLHCVQLHGDESPEYCRRLSHEGIPVIKALDARLSRDRLEEYRDQVSCFLFDTPGPGRGGTGQKFDWGLLQKIPAAVPFLLGGGIGPEDAGALLALDHEGLRGVDVNSRFELSPGVKDVEKLQDFMSKLKTA